MDGSSAELADTGAVTIDGAKVSLALAAAPADTARSLTVGYTAPALSVLRDAARNNVADFTESHTFNEAPTGNPVVSGLAHVGQTLTADISGIVDADGMTKATAGDTDFAFTYAWLQIDGTDETVISDATSDSYELAITDEGKKIAVRVQYTDDDDYVESLTSDPLGPVRAMNAVRGAPAISGFPRVGDVVTVSKGTLSDPDGMTKADAGDIGFTYQYQWVRSDTTSEMDIDGATSSTYTLTTADVGKRIKVRTSFSDDANNAEVSDTSSGFPNIYLSNSPTDVVLPMAVCRAPDLTGRRELWSSTVNVQIESLFVQGYQSANAEYESIGYQLGI